MYDIIGDVHGHYRELYALLEKMGYVYDAAAHSFAHPSRKVLFVGDLIDAGSENRKVVELVQNMERAGRAKVVMGNHEFNAVQYASPSNGLPGEFQRRHDESNRHQHSKFLHEYEHEPKLYADVIDWFKTLPLYLVVDRLHVIHACWYGSAMETLRTSGSLTSTGQMTAQGWTRSGDKSSPDYPLFEILLKGPEDTLGEGLCFIDGYGHARTKSRIKWWVETPKTYGEAYNIPLTAPFFNEAFPVMKSAAAARHIREGLNGVDQLIFGHYWMRENQPAILSPKAACVDYSVARHDGLMVAYRHQPDEPTLRSSNFVVVPKIS